MPTFATSEPITAEVDLLAGAVQINAGDRSDTTVEVRPRDAAKDADVRAAEQIQIEYAGGRLLVKDPGNTVLGSMLRKGMADVTVDLPRGSLLHAHARHANIRCEGDLGAAEITTSSGNIALDRLTGNAELTASDGWVRAHEIDGRAVIKTSSGAITLGTVSGKLRMNTAHGHISAQRALESVHARATHGSARIGEVVRGRVDIETSYGEIEVGVREGTAAWLDAASKHGALSSSLEAAEGPGTAEETVEVRARSVYGDIVVRRA
ncbi:DUF4097 family beta strand repeat-containing protein [Nocardiopsis rhodophaea]|uniref:DUF4097 family beta strand repeat-containing protein n=1 Tax=Nocardiopsis rhodophaea TaxID=280238 RepID=A0ABP5EP72_9ACTN